MRDLEKVLIAGGLAAAVAGSGYGIYLLTSVEEAPTFRFANVTRGSIQSLVSATGTLQAVTTVGVGTRVSGQISELLVDFNDQVKKGQLLARIDPTSARQGVADATVRSARVALERAKQNLSFTSIYAPIDGVVVERNVNLGQTVAVSLSAPQLILIANDLSRVQILSLVGESDIVRTEQGQSVSFTVLALPAQKLSGTVEQVRLQSTTADNVVNYTVVVTLENPGGKLLPGMTARVDFLVKSAEGVLKVPNAALRYKPSDEILAGFGAASVHRDGTAVRTASADPSRSEGAAGSRTRRAEGSTSGRGATDTLYTLDAKGKLRAVRVRTGITDGLFRVRHDAARDLAELSTGTPHEPLRPLPPRDAEHQAIRDWQTDSGSFFGPEDVRGARSVAVPGRTVADRVFPGSDPIGEEIQIAALRFLVTGVLSPKGQTATGSDSDDVILVPYTTAATRLTGRPRIPQILAARRRRARSASGSRSGRAARTSSSSLSSRAS